MCEAVESKKLRRKVILTLIESYIELFAFVDRSDENARRPIEGGSRGSLELKNQTQQRVCDPSREQDERES